MHSLTRHNPQSRQVARRVRDGVVQRKNRHAPGGDPYWHDRPYPRIERQPPGDGHRHLLRKRDVGAFIDLLPDWDELRRGLNAILLATARTEADGWHRRGTVAVCAWPRELSVTVGTWYHDAHQQVFNRLAVPTRQIGDDTWQLDFTENAARAYQLLHILLHELGHHHDRMTTRAQQHVGRGELYAEVYALRYADRIWDDYFRVFAF
jgi:hypothetical protein